MRKFGVVIALAVELENVLNALGNIDKVEEVGAYEVYFVSHGKCKLFVVVSGAGEIAASATTQMLISKYSVDAIFNFGFVGSLDNTLACQQVVIGKDIVHYDINTEAVDNMPVGRYDDFDDIYVPCSNALIAKAVEYNSKLRLVRIASGDTFIADSAKKQWLIETFHADICDMESAGIVITASRNKIPVLCLKVISDNADEKSPIDFIEIAYNGSKACAKILAGILDEIAGNKNKREKFSKSPNTKRVKKQ
ncbi:MAG: 5'-methylthioadenosine/S-adenosylhomocysteine nucleosidase [Clostridia bacterium]